MDGVTPKLVNEVIFVAWVDASDRIEEGSGLWTTGSTTSAAVGLLAVFFDGTLCSRLPLTFRDLIVAFERREQSEPRVQYSVSLNSG